MPVKWGYAIGQWNCPRREQQERVLKVMSACGFKGVELRFGSGRWAPLGKRDLIELNFGSVKDLKGFVESCAMQVASFYYNPTAPLEGEDPEYWMGRPAPRCALNPDDHARTVEGARAFASLLAELGGTCLVVPPVPSYWTVGSLTDAQIRTAAECWNKVGAMTQSEYGISTALHLDCLSALHSAEAIDKLMEFTDRRYVSLALDTAELTIAGIDPVALYEKHHARVGHVHFKDTLHTDELSEYKKPFAEFELLDEGGERKIDRWFWEMGTDGGRVDFPALFAAMKKHSYEGWVIVECDHTANPAESALLNSWYVQAVLSKVE